MKQKVINRGYCEKKETLLRVAVAVGYYEEHLLYVI